MLKTYNMLSTWIYSFGMMASTYMAVKRLSGSCEIASQAMSYLNILFIVNNAVEIFITNDPNFTQHQVNFSTVIIISYYGVDILHILFNTFSREWVFVIHHVIAIYIGMLTTPYQMMKHAHAQNMALLMASYALVQIMSWIYCVHCIMRYRRL